MKLAMTNASILICAFITACAANRDDADVPSAMTNGRNVSSNQVPVQRPFVKQPSSFPGRELTDTVSYWEGRAQRTLWVSDELIAEFEPSEQTAAAVRLTAPEAQVVVTEPRVRLWKVAQGQAATQLDRMRAVSSAAMRLAPVLHDGKSPGLPRRSLPGGVLVTFPPAWDRARIEQFLANRQLTIAKELEPKRNSVLISTAPGLVAIEIANQLVASGQVESATPNWWREVGVR
ncbi:MAG: hypothetical protein U1E76_01415 [Planctomycetota bacterium]